MVVAVSCCSWEIKKCVKTTAIVGIVISLLSLLTVFYIPISFAFLAAYILVFKGLQNQKSKYLLTAQVIFGPLVLINLVLVYALLIVALEEPWTSYKWNVSHGGEVKSKIIKVLLVASVFLLHLLIAFTIFTIIIVQKVKNLIIAEFLEANLPPEEPRNHINFGGRGFPNIYSADPNPSNDLSQQNQYISPSQMTETDYININASATYYRR